MMKRSVRTFVLCTAFSLSVLSATTVRADEKGDKILRRAFSKLFASKAMSADITQTISGEGLAESIVLKGTVAVLKPNYLRIELKGEEQFANLNFVFVSDGQNYFDYISSPSKQYGKTKVSLTPTEFTGMWEGEVDAFFGGEKNALKVKTDYEGEELYNKIPCEIVKTESKGINNATRTITYTIGKKDSIIYRAAFPAGSPEESAITHTNTLTNIKLMATKTPADFTYKPPTGATLRKPPPPPLDRAELKPSSRLAQR